MNNLKNANHLDFKKSAQSNSLFCKPSVWPQWFMPSGLNPVLNGLSPPNCSKNKCFSVLILLGFPGHFILLTSPSFLEICSSPFRRCLCLPAEVSSSQPLGNPSSYGFNCPSVPTHWALRNLCLLAHMCTKAQRCPDVFKCPRHLKLITSNSELITSSLNL